MFCTDANSKLLPNKLTLPNDHHHHCTVSWLLKPFLYIRWVLSKTPPGI